MLIGNVGNERTKYIDLVKTEDFCAIVSTAWVTDYQMFETMIFSSDENGIVENWNAIDTKRCLGDDEVIKQQHDEMVRQLKS